MNLRLFGLLLAFLRAGAQDVKIYHRLWDGVTQPAPQFVLRTTASDDGLTQPGKVSIIINNMHDIYQVAIQTSFEPLSWIVSSTKACFLPMHKQDTITVHLTPSNKPYATDYSVHPTPEDGKCPLVNPLTAGSKEITFINTTVVVSHSALPPPQPELKAPILVSTTGEPIQPLPEKSFIQKYWVYMLIAFLGIVLSGGPEEQNSRGRRTQR